MFASRILIILMIFISGSVGAIDASLVLRSSTAIKNELHTPLSTRANTRSIESSKKFGIDMSLLKRVAVYGTVTSLVAEGLIIRLAGGSLTSIATSMDPLIWFVGIDLMFTGFYYMNMQHTIDDPEDIEMLP